MTTTQRVQRAVRPVTYQSPDVVARALGPKLGIGADSAHQILVGPLNTKAAAVIDAHIEYGALDRLTRWLSPLHAAENRVPVPALTSALVASAMVKDGTEDGALVILAAELHDLTVARATLRAIYAEITAKQQLARAICAAHGLTA